MSYPSEQRSNLEKLWANQQAAEHLSAEDHKLWLTHRHVQRLMLGESRTLIHYRPGQGAPIVLGVYEVRDVQASFVKGLSFSLEDISSKQRHDFGHIPKFLPGSTIFLWATYFPDFQHTRVESGRFATWFAVAMKFSSRPEYAQEGAEHLVDVRSFRRLYPNNNTSF